MTQYEEAQQKVANALSQATDGRLILRSVVVYESLTEDGQRVMSVIESPDCRTWDIIGLTDWALECAKERQRYELRRSVSDD